MSDLEYDALAGLYALTIFGVVGVVLWMHRQVARARRADQADRSTAADDGRGNEPTSRS